MSTYRIEGRVIDAGYVWRQRLQFDTTEVVFPVGVALAAHVRATRIANSILATLTTANGGLTRVSDQSIDIVIAASATALMPVGTVVVDIVRTDVDPDEHLGIALNIPVQMPVTRGLA